MTTVNNEYEFLGWLVILLGSIFAVLAYIQIRTYLSLSKKEENLRTSNNMMFERIIENREKIESPVDPVMSIHFALRQLESEEKDRLNRLYRLKDELNP